MTMTNLAVSILVLFAFLILGRVYATLKLRTLQLRQFHRGAFFAGAEELIEDSATPSEFIPALHYLALTINDFGVVLTLARLSTCNLLGINRGSKLPTELNAAMNEAPRSIRRKFLRTYREAVAAVSYRSLLLGPIIRSGIPNKKRGSSSSLEQTVMKDIMRRGRRQHRNDNDPLAASGLCGPG